MLRNNFASIIPMLFVQFPYMEMVKILDTVDGAALSLVQALRFTLPVSAYRMYPAMVSVSTGGGFLLGHLRRPLFGSLLPLAIFAI